MKVAVCVMALVRGEVDSVQPDELRDYLLNQQFGDLDSVYHKDSRADWQPFGDGTTRHYMTKHHLEPDFSLFEPAGLADLQSRLRLFDEVDLFLVDPLLLTLNTIPEDFLMQLDGTIRQRCKFCCVIMPEGIPPGLSNTLEATLSNKLPLAYLQHQEGRGLSIVRRTGDFRTYLEQQLMLHLKICEIKGLLQNRGVRDPELDDIDTLRRAA